MQCFTIGTKGFNSNYNLPGLVSGKEELARPEGLQLSKSYNPFLNQSAEEI